MSPDPRFIGCIRIQPALTDAECDFLLGVLESGGTLRGTPTGRGDADVRSQGGRFDNVIEIRPRRA